MAGVKGTKRQPEQKQVILVWPEQPDRPDKSYVEHQDSDQESEQHRLCEPLARQGIEGQTAHQSQSSAEVWKARIDAPANMG